ncbi:histidinol dehydrogenase [bacterium]|nr:histidinol dehydrogenase [bacterium]
MSNLLRIIETGQEEFLDELARRKADDLDRVSADAAAIVARVRQDGDRALTELTEKFDRVHLEPETFRVSRDEIDSAASGIDPQLARDLEAAYARILDYHRRQAPNSWFYTGADGEILGQRVLPVDSAAIYAPGGKAAYPSSVLMGAGAAVAAGVPRVVLLSPPDRQGGLNPAVLFCARLAGIEEVYRLGGAQAIAAAAYGTESVPAVDVIAGPGNIYVTAAKKLVFGKVGIDMLAGPSEVLVIADESPDPAWVAADLLSQAEHDERAGCILVTTSSALAEKVAAELQRRLEALPKAAIAAQAVENFSAALVARSMEHAAALANRFAPEHLEILTADPWAILGKIRHAGAVFLGPWSPEPVGDYWAGPNHVLPTGGSARVFSPLGVEVFLRRSSLIAFNREAFAAAAAPVARLARAEGLEAHARSVEARDIQEKK